MASVKRLPVAWFRSMGFLQEVNRRVLHPAGLALGVSTGWTKKEFAEHMAQQGYRYGPVALDSAWAAVVVLGLDREHVGGVWDYRDDPEGIVFGAGELEASKADSVDAAILAHADHRRALMGDIVQPLGWAP